MKINGLTPEELAKARAHRATPYLPKVNVTSISSDCSDEAHEPTTTNQGRTIINVYNITVNNTTNNNYNYDQRRLNVYNDNRSVNMAQPGKSLAEIQK